MVYVFTQIQNSLKSQKASIENYIIDNVHFRWIIQCNIKGMDFKILIKRT